MIPDPRQAPTLDAGTVATLLGCSKWALYEAVKRGDSPVVPLRVGRVLRFPTARVIAVLGLGEEREG